MSTRRDVMLRSAAGLAIIATMGPSFIRSAGAQASLNMTEVLAATNPLLPDLVYGPNDAKVTIIEYASTTCSHCARFHNDILPELKAKYIDTGKVRFIFRNFVLNPLDTAASMLSYCGPSPQRGAFVDFLFRQQEKWAFTSSPLDSLMAAARQTGFTQESFNACLQRKDLYDALIASKDKAADGFKVNSTPTLIINGQVHRGALSMPELDRILQPLVGS